MWMFIEVLFNSPKTGSNSNVLHLVNEYANCSLCTMESYSAIKKNELLTHRTTQMNCKYICQEEARLKSYSLRNYIYKIFWERQTNYRNKKTDQWLPEATGGSVVDWKGTRGNLVRRWGSGNCSLSLLSWCLHDFMNLSKFIKLYTKKG